MKHSHSARVQSLLILEDIANHQSYPNQAIQNVIKAQVLSSVDQRFMVELVYGTLSRQITLDAVLDQWIKKPQKVDVWTRCLLRLSLYQLMYLDKIPNYSVVNEAVKIAKRYRHEGVARFVNGVLRQILRQDQWLLTWPSDRYARLSIEYSVPVWLVQKFEHDFGSEKTEALLASLLHKSKLMMRNVHPDQISTEALCEQLEKEGMVVSKSSWNELGIWIQSGDVFQSELFLKGYLTVQDESSMLVAPTLQIQPTDQVLDMCAAPGGKTGHLAYYIDPKQGGRIYALDQSQKKVDLIQENIKRLGYLDRVTCYVQDATQLDQRFSGKQFDKILLDAPCSGLGLIRRKPDIRYTKQPLDFKALADVQKALLKQAVAHLKVGGRLTYSTCTIAPEENEQVIQWFLKHYPNMRYIPWQADHIPTTPVTYGMQLLPSDADTDGFYICCLEKISE